jgi:hypothetical protein
MVAADTGPIDLDDFTPRLAHEIEKEQAEAKKIEEEKPKVEASPVKKEPEAELGCMDKCKLKIEACKT